MQLILYASALGAAIFGWICMMGFGSLLVQYRKAGGGHGHGAVEGRDHVHELFVQFVLAAGLIIVSTLIAAYAAHLGAGG